MARTPLDTHIYLDHIHCSKQSDSVAGSAEPYLWTIFFKIDGDTVSLGDDLMLHGTCTLVTTPGSHGDLDDDDVDEGDDVPVPMAIGDYVSTLTPIPVPADVTQKYGVADVGGVCGIVMVLMEEDWVSDDGAEAGHQELNRFVEDAIDGIIPTLGATNQDVTDTQLKDLTDRAVSAVSDAVEKAQGTWDNATSYLNGDDNLGAKVLQFKHDVLVDATAGIYERFQQFVTVNNTFGQPQQVEVENWLIAGEAQGTTVANPHGYETVNRSRDVGAPKGTFAPATLWRPNIGAEEIIYRDDNGHVHELWRDANGVGTSDLTALGGAPAATGNPSTYIDTTTGMEIVLFRGDDANVHSLYWLTGGVGHDNLTGSVGAPTAEGNPVGFYTDSNQVHQVFYRGYDQHMHALYWSGPSPVAHDDLTALSSSPLAVGDPSPYLDTTRGQNILAYHGQDGHIHTLYWSLGAVGHDDLSGYAQTPNAAGDPAGYYTAWDDTNQIVYRTEDGRIFELWWNGVAPVNGWDLTTAAGAPPAGSDPAAYYSAGTNTKHVIYRSTENHIIELWWVPGGGTPAMVDLTTLARGRWAVDKPAAYTIDGPNTQHVAYRGTDNELHEIRWS